MRDGVRLEAAQNGVMKEPLAPTHSRVLLVDRDPIGARYFGGILNAVDSSCQLTYLNNPDAASTLLKESERENLPDLIVTGTRFDLGDGFQFAREITEKYPDIYVVVLTSSRLVDIPRVQQEASGAKMFLEKPISDRGITRILTKTQEFKRSRRK